ncbi:MAG: hypothetical protein WC288_02735 [Candidatus Paceibacterota bacterium]|jgi:hypothetical protein|nr:hypothetical protein [Candidatus Paceibacterota bacterium]MDD3548684.1 hypothetical protein [Candidatus Paceibacterota bacterium]MDD4998970.1 hypothetical protein [Candidatus Paceibacterota bacterium]MDD5545425.1 hypothetical protein [Candidatus Paceibacterota bacterium]
MFSVKEFIVILFFILKIVSFLAGILFFIGIIYYLKKLNLFLSWKEKCLTFFNFRPPPSSFNDKKQWLEIRNLLEEPYQSSWKLAVMKAETLVEKILRTMGYPEEDFEKQLKELKLRGYKNLEVLQEIYKIKKEIAEKENYFLSQKEAKNIVAILKKFRDELVNSL